MTSPVQQLKAEVEAIAQAYIDLQQVLDNIARDAEQLKHRWYNTGLSSNAKHVANTNDELGRFHTDLGSLGAGAFHLGVCVGVVGANL
jgi:hypothetical protein